MSKAAVAGPRCGTGRRVARDGVGHSLQGESAVAVGRCLEPVKVNKAAPSGLGVIDLGDHPHSLDARTQVVDDPSSIVAPAFSSTLTSRSPPASTTGKLGTRPVAITDRTLGESGTASRRNAPWVVGGHLGNAGAADAKVPPHDGFWHDLAVGTNDRAGDGAAVHRPCSSLRCRTFGRFRMEDEIDLHRPGHQTRRCRCAPCPGWPGARAVSLPGRPIDVPS